MRTKTLVGYDPDEIDLKVAKYENELDSKFTQTHVFSANGKTKYVYVLFYEGD